MRNILWIVIMLMVIGSPMFMAQKVYAHGGGDNPETQMTDEEKDTGTSAELASLNPDEEDEQMIHDSQHGK